MSNGTSAIGAAILQIFHVAAAGLIERMKQAVVDAVEVERLDPGALAQNLVEGRRALHPFPVDLELGVGVPIKRIADLLLEPLRGEMVAHVGIAGPCRNAGRARGGGKKRRLADAKAATGAQHVTGAEFGRIEKIDIRVVLDLIAHRAVERERFVLDGFRVAERVVRKRDDRRIVAVDESRGVQIVGVFCRHFFCRHLIHRHSLPGMRHASKPSTRHSAMRRPSSAAQ